MVDMASRGSTSRYLRIPRRCTCRRSRLEDMACCAQCPKCQKGPVFHPACEAPAHSDSEIHRAVAGRLARNTAAIVLGGGSPRTTQAQALGVVSCASFIHQLCFGFQCLKSVTNNF